MYWCYGTGTELLVPFCCKSTGNLSSHFTHPTFYTPHTQITVQQRQTFFFIYKEQQNHTYKTTGENAAKGACRTSLS